MQVLIIGLGSIAKKHISVLQKIVVDLNIQALRSGVIEETNAGNIDFINSWKYVKTPDIILICNPTSFHVNAIEKAVEFGCPLFIEKPLSHKWDEQEKIILQKVIERDIKTYIACNLRFHPVINFFKDFLITNKSKINEINIYCGSHLPAWRPGVDFRFSYSANPDMGGGVHLDLIHELDYLVYLLGPPLRTSSLLTKKSSLRISSVDSARYLLEYNDFSVSITLNYFRRDTRRFVEIVREEDTLFGDLVNCSVTDTVTGNILFQDQDFDMFDTYLAQMNYFLKNKDGKMMNDISEASRTLQIALA